MRKRAELLLVLLVLLGGGGLSAIVLCGADAPTAVPAQNEILTYLVDPAKVSIRFYWRDDRGQRIALLTRLHTLLRDKKQQLLFAANGGMFTTEHAPLGLYIEDGTEIHKLNTRRGEYGNFYLQPNGVFFVRANGTAEVVCTGDYKPDPAIRYATQSGPMLVVNGEINRQFRPGSDSLYIRNGVGLLPDGRVLFALSSAPVNLYRFADFFRAAGCRNALYLDGAISRMYPCSAPEPANELGVLIAVTAKP